MTDLLFIALSLHGLLGVLSTRWRNMVALDLEVFLLLRVWLRRYVVSLPLVDTQGHEMKLWTSSSMQIESAVEGRRLTVIEARDFGIHLCEVL